MVLAMSEKQVHIEAFWRSLNHYGEELCGDRVMIKRGDGFFVLVLADGLGSGVKANILSTLTSTIISEMIVEGTSLKDCIDTISATLPVCSERGEAYSTFTIIQVYYDGETYLIQFDNPVAVVISNGRVFHPEDAVVEMTGNRKVHVTEFKMKPGDYIVTFSDGILYAGTEMQLNLAWDQKAVEQFLMENTSSYDSAAEICRVLLANVNYLYGGMPGDDSTVACVKIIEAKETVVMAGPPLHNEDDGKVVERLLSATDKKIVCGGTTAKIVSRITGNPINPTADEVMTEDVPPTSMIKGIDLVTEGVLTLQKTAWYIRHAKDDHDFRDSLMLSKSKDGATLLSKALLTSSGVTFLMGLSNNEAYADMIHSAVSLDLKVQLIQELSENLKELGKIVKIEKY